MESKEMGTCKHGTFPLSEGCPQCIADAMVERKAAALENETPRHIVQVRYGTDATEGRPYSYYSEDALQVGDLVEVPTKNGLLPARVIAIGITEAEIASFKDAMRTIPAGSIIQDLAAAPVLDRKVNLCDTCKKQPEYPICSPRDVEFGDGVGNDNIIKCSNYGIRPELEEIEDGLNAEGLTLAGAQEAEPTADAELEAVKPSPDAELIHALPVKEEAEPVAETAVALRPGADAEAMSWHAEGLKALVYADERKVTNADEYALASDDLSIVSKLKKLMTARRKELLDPLKAESDAIRETYTFLMEPVDKADQITRAKMTAYLSEQARIKVEQERINQQRMEAAEAEMKLKGEITEPVNLMPVQPDAPKSVRTELGSSGLTDHWTYEIIDITLIPREYMMLDTVLLGNTAKKYHDQKEVPGVRFFNKPYMATRPR